MAVDSILLMLLACGIGGVGLGIFKGVQRHLRLTGNRADLTQRFRDWAFAKQIGGWRQLVRMLVYCVATGLVFGVVLALATSAYFGAIALLQTFGQFTWLVLPPIAKGAAGAFLLPVAYIGIIGPILMILMLLALKACFAIATFSKAPVDRFLGKTGKRPHWVVRFYNWAHAESTSAGGTIVRQMIFYGTVIGAATLATIGGVALCQRFGAFPAAELRMIAEVSAALFVYFMTMLLLLPALLLLAFGIAKAYVAITGARVRQNRDGEQNEVQTNLGQPSNQQLSLERFADYVSNEPKTARHLLVHLFACAGAAFGPIALAFLGVVALLQPTGLFQWIDVSKSAKGTMLLFAAIMAQPVVVWLAIRFVRWGEKVYVVITKIRGIRDNAANDEKGD